MPFEQKIQHQQEQQIDGNVQQLQTKNVQAAGRIDDRQQQRVSPRIGYRSDLSLDRIGIADRDLVLLEIAADVALRDTLRLTDITSKIIAPIMPRRQSPINKPGG